MPEPAILPTATLCSTGIEAARAIGIERTPAKSCISRSGGQKTKRIAPFCCREVGKAHVHHSGWCWGWRGRKCGRRRGRRYRRGRRHRTRRAIELNAIEIRGPVTNDRIIELERVAADVQSDRYLY